MPVEFEEYRESHDGEGFDWTLREGSNAHTILAFLAEHPNQGFTPKEIHEVTGVTRGSVGKTLERLKERQLVRHAEPYWAIGDEDRVGTYLDEGRDLSGSIEAMQRDYFEHSRDHHTFAEWVGESE